jgi:hypothetical protein
MGGKILPSQLRIKAYKEFYSWMIWWPPTPAFS